MNPLGSATVLDLWEVGLRMTPAARATMLLEAAGERGIDDWLVGRRDRTLLERYCPGAVLDTLTRCPSCGTQLELSVDAREIVGDGSPESVPLDVGGYRLVVRALTVGDLGSLPVDEAPDRLRAALLERCVVRAARAGVDVAPAELPEAVVERVEAVLDRLDPTADIVIALVCADCGESWSEPLDPVRFVWSAVESAAHRLAGDVHTLALAYGWSEADILRLSPVRRHLYLSAVS